MQGSVVLLLVLGLAVGAAAQPLDQAAPAPAAGEDASAAPAPPALPSEAAQYEALIADALGQYRGGRFVQARALFRRAHELYPSARPLRGIGLCAFELGDYAAAVRHLQAAMHELRRPLDDHLRTETGKVLERARAFVGVLELSVTPPDAQVTVGAQQGVVGELVLNPGVHTVRVEAPGYTPQEHRVRARGGRTTQLVIALSQEATPALAPSVAPAAPSAAQANGRARTGPLLLGGLGVAALVGGTITALLTDSAKDDLDASCARGSCDESARDRGKTTKTLTNVLLPTGAGLLVGATLWWLLDDGGDEASVGARCDRDGCGVLIRGRL